MKKNEQLKAVRGYDGYVISTEGVVKSVDRIINYNDGRSRECLGRLITQREGRDGYLSVRLSKEGMAVTKYVHRLVAENFIEAVDGKLLVNHIDGNKHNNSADNLQWVSHAENVKHAYDMGLNKNKSANHVFAVGIYHKESDKYFPTIKAFCEYFGLNYNTVRNAMNGYSQCPKTIDLSSYSITKLKAAVEQDGK